MTSIDLNADLGEGDAFDEALLAIVSSCNIACGGHTGDAATMATTVALARQHDVAIGAHPSYPDPDGFGRRSGFLLGDALTDSLVEQIESLQAITHAAGATMTHVKPHGALYNDAARDSVLAANVISAVKRAAPDCVLVGPPASALEAAANDAGLSYRCEAFVDRAYLADGALAPRAEPGAVHSELSTITTQAVRLAQSQQVTAQNGEVITIAADTLCIHGDTDNADVAAAAVRDVLEANGIEIRA